jgi:hypothetical protein
MFKYLKYALGLLLKLRLFYTNVAREKKRPMNGSHYRDWKKKKSRYFCVLIASQRILACDRVEDQYFSPRTRSLCP